MNRAVFFAAVAAVASSGAVALVSACTDNGSAGSGVTGDASTDAAGIDARGPTEMDSGIEPDGRAQATTCQITREYTLDCNKDKPDGGEPLTCGNAKFDQWCELNDKAINSASFRRAQTLCLTPANCDPDKRKDCEYKTYASATPTAAQKAVALAYCQTCEPANPTACVTRETTYKTALGPESTDDVFIAAWELNDALDDEIRTKCTGNALDAGTTPDASTCLKQFANCAGGIYIDHLPDCP